MKLIYRLFLGFFSVVLLTAFVGLIGMDCTMKLGNTIHMMEEVHIPGTTTLLSAVNAAHKASTDALEYSLRGKEANRVHALEALGEIQALLSKYATVADHKQHTKSLEDQEVVLLEKAAVFDKSIRTYLVLAGGYILENSQTGNYAFAGSIPNDMFQDEDTLATARNDFLHSLYKVLSSEKDILEATSNQASAIAQNTRKLILVTAMVALLLALFQGVMLSRSISNPLDRLVQAAVEIGHGRLNTPIDTGGDDEIGRLGDALGQMARNMRESRKKLIGTGALKKAQEALQKSENLLQTLINTTRDAMISIDQTGKVTLFNPAGERMFQRTRDEMIGQSVDCLMPDEHRKNHSSYLSGFFATGKPDSAMGKILELPAVRGDGTTFPMEISLSTGQADSKTFVVAIARDISERKKTEENIIRAKQEWERTFDAVPDLIAIIDGNHKIVRVNKSMANAFGTSPNLMVGRHCYEAVHNMGAPPDFCPHMASLSDGSFHEVEIYDEGLDAHFQVSTSPMKDGAGNIVASVHIMRDITDRKRAESELEKTHTKLVETARQVGMAEVATGVLHSVGNVLNSVNVSTECIQRNVRESRVQDLADILELVEQHPDDLPHFLFEDEQGREIMPFIKDLSLHLMEERDAMLKEIKDLSVYAAHISEIVNAQQERSKVPGLVEPIALREILEEVLFINSARLERKGVKVVREYEEIPRVAADRHKLTQIFMNLVSNAGHALEDWEGNDKVLTLRLLSPGPGIVAMEVSDNGQGILRQNMSRLFRYGFTTKQKGHGFGLHSCALAAQEMGGNLDAASDGKGKGSTFTLTLPTLNGDADNV